MASAILASRNEPHWREPKVYMRKPPGASPNPNPRPASAKSDARPAAAAAASEDSSSFGHRSAPPAQAPASEYVTYNIASFSRGELRELRRRLVAELDRIRSLAARIEASAARSGYPPPPVISVDSPEKRTPISKPPGGGKRGPWPPLAAGGKKGAAGPQSDTAEMKRCRQMLGRLMRHKDCWIFLEPVDAEKWALHDYHQIILCPMDLGTVKKKLDAGLYALPADFVADVRLTFNNALTYNPPGHDVYKWAVHLLALFNQMCQTQFPRAEPPPPLPIPLPIVVENAAPEVAAHQPHFPRVMAGKLPKPKAKEPNKREMSLEEKQKLGLALQNLPQEKMEQVVQIVKRRNNSNVYQDGDEIELDIEQLDTETLWELDRFVGNCKKMMSKMKRQALAGGNPALPMPANEAKMPAADEAAVAREAKRVKRGGEIGEEDVDIGEEVPTMNFPPVVIEKDAKSSSSSSSSSDSSSSSGSDTGSSSGSDTDSDEVESPFVGARAASPKGADKERIGSF